MYESPAGLRFVIRAVIAGCVHLRKHTKTKTGVTAIWALLDWSPIQAGVILKRVILSLEEGNFNTV